MQDLRRVRGVTYKTCQEAAKALGLIESDDETYKTLHDAMGGSSPAGVRKMFSCMMMHGFPTAIIYNNDDPSNAVLR